MTKAIGSDGWAVKGGVNLRLFFGSPRFSEDMDLDGLPRARDRMRREIKRILSSKSFRQRLARLGIQDITPILPRAQKDTETTLRFKLGLVVGGGVSLPTKVEVSFRTGNPDDEVLAEPANPTIAGLYLDAGELPLRVPHYTKISAIRQKIAALDGRTYAQARDVFDIGVLAKTPLTDVEVVMLRRSLSNSTLDNAQTRALQLPEKEYQDKVLEFLGEPIRTEYAGTWEDQQLFTSELIHAVRALDVGIDARPKPTAHDPTGGG